MTETAAAREWDAQVEFAQRQHGRVFRDEDESDHWSGLVSSFSPPPDAGSEDPVIGYLRSVFRKDSILLDVGAGAGRLAVPAASLCGGVIALEPSPAMSAELNSQIAHRGIENISVVSSQWEEWAEEPVDVVLMSHVLYGAAPIAPFVRKAVEVARECVVAVLGLSPPGDYYHPLWQSVRGEDRVTAPSAREFERLLESWEYVPEIIELPGIAARSFRDREEAITRSARRLRVRLGTPAHDELEKAVDLALVASQDGTCHFRWRQPSASLLFRWPNSND